MYNKRNNRYTGWRQLRTIIWHASYCYIRPCSSVLDIGKQARGYLHALLSNNYATPFVTAAQSCVSVTILNLLNRKQLDKARSNSCRDISSTCEIIPSVVFSNTKCVVDKVFGVVTGIFVILHVVSYPHWSASKVYEHGTVTVWTMVDIVWRRTLCLKT
jgi:hypothetical protein